MSVEQRFDEEQSPSGVLSGNVVESISVREQSDSYVVTFPKDCAEDPGIEKGENVLFVGKQGDDSLEVGPANRVFSE